MIEKTSTIDIGWNLENSYASLPKPFFAIQDPDPVRSPKLVIINRPLATFLGLNENNVDVEEFVGNKIPEGALPLAQAYAGHQFGYFTMLGDGRAILLGEQITPSGERFDIQLKGSGRTPYSRGGDGRAALGPMLREYIISEAMHRLGIATTRSLAVVTTGESVMRETKQPGAILTRVAASHIRVGTFQYIAEWGSIDELKALSDYTLQRHFPYVNSDENRYLALLREVIKRQAVLISKWQLVGFIHGVMNTDNMTISGETIDYGPCAFMDTYDPATVFSSIDTRGRYAYRNQPDIAVWNLSRFAETLLPLIHKNKEEAIRLAEEAVSDFYKIYEYNWFAGMRAKLGIFNEEQNDESIIEDFLSIMNKYGADFTNTFRALTIDNLEDMTLYGTPEFKQWYELWKARLERQKESRASSHQLMQSNNPSIIPRNHRVEEALEAAVEREDYSVMERLINALSSPYSYSNEQVSYSVLPPPSTCRYQTFCGT